MYEAAKRSHQCVTASKPQRDIQEMRNSAMNKEQRLHLETAPGRLSFKILKSRHLRLTYRARLWRQRKTADDIPEQQPRKGFSDILKQAGLSKDASPRRCVLTHAVVSHRIACACAYTCYIWKRRGILGMRASEKETRKSTIRSDIPDS